MNYLATIDRLNSMDAGYKRHILVSGVDKYLKVARLIKRRTLAKEASENERILVNGKVVKPSKELKIGDEITIEFGNKSVTVRVASLEVSTNEVFSSTSNGVFSKSGNFTSMF